MFTYLKNRSRSQNFNNNEEFIEGVKMWLSSQAADFFDTGVCDILPRHDKSLSSGGDSLRISFSM
jgi:hypothetical protein